MQLYEFILGNRSLLNIQTNLIKRIIICQQLTEDTKVLGRTMKLYRLSN